MKILTFLLAFFTFGTMHHFVLAEGNLYETSAEEMQSYMCKLEGQAGAGHIIFNFKPLDSVPGLIEYSGLFSGNDGYSAIVHRVNITKIHDPGDGSYSFEGTDESIGGGKVNGFFKDTNNFEVNGYFAEKYSDMDCIFYRLTPLKSSWAKQVVKDNPKFKF